MNLKCQKISQFEDFHRECMQRIYEVKDYKNILWKQVYLVALPSRFVDYIKLQEIFQLPFESYTWGEIYSLVTKTLVSLCTSSMVNRSLENICKLRDRKSICNKYGLTIDDPLVQKRKAKRKAKKEYKQTTKIYRHKRHTSKRPKASSTARKGYYRYVPMTHYYKPSDIHLHTSKQEKWNKHACWLRGKIGHTSTKCPDGEESKKNRGKKSQALFQRGKNVKTEGQLQCLKCGSCTHKTKHRPNVIIKDQIQRQQL